MTRRGYHRSVGIPAGGSPRAGGKRRATAYRIIAGDKSTVAGRVGYCEAVRRAGIIDFAEKQAKALFFVMSTHVRLALDELIEAMNNLFDPFMEGGHFSWMSVLKELVFDVGDVEQTQHEVTKLNKDSLNHFRASSD